MSTITEFLTKTRGRRQPDLTDIITYLYLALGTLLMFGPVVWLVLSSFKTPAEIATFPPRLLPYRQETVEVEGYDEPLPLYEVTLDDGSTAVMAQARRIANRSRRFPSAPTTTLKVYRVSILPRICATAS
jgi:alpha-1,4-digalacturonate transport system permease protein